MINFAENLNKMIAAGLGGETEAPRTEVAVGHRLQYLDASGPVASFDTNIVAPLKKLLVSMLPIQAGSGDPSPENIRPITGRDSVTVYRTGKNLLYAPAQKTVTINGVTWTVNADGSITVSGTATEEDSVFRYIDGAAGVSLAGDYKIACFPLGISANVLLCGIWFNKWVSFNASKVWDMTGISGQVRQMWLRVKAGQSLNTTIFPMICLASESVTKWSPYVAQSVTVSLGQTVYGGTLDVLTGALLSKWANIASYNGEALPGEWISDRDVYAPGATPSIGAQVVYELADPVEIDLTPEQITTLIGDNNVWSDAGDVDVTYIYYEETEGY